MNRAEMAKVIEQQDRLIAGLRTMLKGALTTLDGLNLSTPDVKAAHAEAMDNAHRAAQILGVQR